VVIQLTPQTELAHLPQEAHLTGEARPPGESPGTQYIHEQGGESPHKPKAGKSRLGVFAQILSGLRKTGTGEKAAGENKPEASAKTSESDVLRSVQKGKNKVGKALAETEKSGETEPELQLQQTGLSIQEKNILFTAGYLAGEFTEENYELADKGINADTAVSPGRRHSAWETAEGVQIEQAGLESTTDKQPETAAATSGELGKDLKITNASPEKTAEKAKNRAEIAAKGETAVVEMSGQGTVQQAEAKKTILGEKEGRNRLDEARNRDKRRGFAVEVQDLRGQSAEIVQKDSVVQVKAGAETRTGEGSAKEITLELRLPNQGQESQSATTSWETKAGQAATLSFEDILSRELHQNFNNDIVRHASVILRDSSGGPAEGTIRLALKPESLGNVKIRLEMAENRITGRIIVESEEALRAFEREITSLEKAFMESGFEGANLEMSLAADGGGAEQWQEMEANQSLARIIAASHYEAATVEWTEMPAALDYYYQGTRSINVLA
jgi:flagellar hook-length control protein FliK